MWPGSRCGLRRSHKPKVPLRPRPGRQSAGGRDLSAQRRRRRWQARDSGIQLCAAFRARRTSPGSCILVADHDAEGFQVANPIERFAIGDRDALKFNGDGSLDLYIQNAKPGSDKESNWLPAPKGGKLGLTLRLYAPKPQAIDGRWNPPAVRRVS